jgi:hypothetical protein
MILMVFSDAVPTAQVTLCQITWEDYHEYWVSKELKGSEHGLFEGTVTTFILKDWGHPHKHLRTAGNYQPKFRYLPNSSLSISITPTGVVQCKEYKLTMLIMLLWTSNMQHL